MCQRAASALWLCADLLLFQVLLLSVLVIAWLQSSPCVHRSLPRTVSVPLVWPHQPLALSSLIHPCCTFCTVDAKGWGRGARCPCQFISRCSLFHFPLSHAASVCPWCPPFPCPFSLWLPSWSFPSLSRPQLSGYWSFYCAT